MIDRSGQNKGKDTATHYLMPSSEGAWTVHRFMFEASTTDVWFAMYCGDQPGLYNGLLWFDDFFLGEFPSGPARPK